VVVEHGLGGKATLALAAAPRQRVGVIRDPRAIVRVPSLPACLRPVTDDYHRPSLLSGFESRGEWVPPPALSGEQARALPGAIEALERDLEPAAPGQVEALLADLAANLPLVDQPEVIWKVHLEAFKRDLADVPVDILVAACDQWRRTKTFWPSIAEFLALVRPRLSERRRQLLRLEVLQRVASDPAPEGIVTAEWFYSVTGRRSRARGRNPVVVGAVLPDPDR